MSEALAIDGGVPVRDTKASPWPTMAGQYRTGMERRNRAHPQRSLSRPNRRATRTCGTPIWTGICRLLRCGLWRDDAQRNHIYCGWIIRRARPRWPRGWRRSHHSQLHLYCDCKCAPLRAVLSGSGRYRSGEFHHVARSHRSRHHRQDRRAPSRSLGGAPGRYGCPQ